MTQMEALELALRLAITAPDQEHADQVILLADQIAATMTQEEVDTIQEEVESSFFSNPQQWQVATVKKELEFGWPEGRN